MIIVIILYIYILLIVLFLLYPFFELPFVLECSFVNDSNTDTDWKNGHLQD